jgi:hypothetical protein
MRDAALPQIVDARGLFRLLFCFVQGGQQHRRQNGDNGDYYQKFNEGESPGPFARAAQAGRPAKKRHFRPAIDG